MDLNAVEALLTAGCKVARSSGSTYLQILLSLSKALVRDFQFHVKFSRPKTNSMGNLSITGGLAIILRVFRLSSKIVQVHSPPNSTRW